MYLLWRDCAVWLFPLEMVLQQRAYAGHARRSSDEDDLVHLIRPHPNPSQHLERCPTQRVRVNPLAVSLAASLAKPLAVPLAVRTDSLATRERDSPLKRDSFM